MPVRQTLLFIFLLVNFVCAAQTSNLIAYRGRIMDKVSGEPVSYATIKLVGHSAVVMSNEKGEFILKAIKTATADSINITHIGYDEIIVAAQPVLLVHLNPFQTSLAPVVVRVPDAVEIIKKAIASIPLNYPLSPYLSNGFYRLTGTGNGGVVHISEAAFDVFNPDYSRGNKQFMLLKARFSKDMAAFKGNDGFDFGTSPQDLLDEDLVSTATATTLIKKDGMKLYSFRYGGTISYNGTIAHVIRFDQKDNIKKALYQGEIYIDAENFAFLEFNFRMSPKGIRYWSIGGAKKMILRLAGIRIDMLQDSTKITYRKFGDKYYLHHVQGSTRWRVVGGRDHFELDPLRMRYNYIVTGIDTAVKNSPGDSKVSPATTFMEKMVAMNASDPADTFWKDYNLILPEFNIDSASEVIRQNNARFGLKKEIEGKLENMRGSSAVRIDTILNYYYNRNRFNGTALVVSENETIYERSFGMANKEQGLLNDSATAYRIGSASKSFTSTLIMQFAAANKLQLDDTVSKHLPGYRHGAVTINQLLTHQSGIPNYTNNENHLAQIISNSYSTQQLVDSFCSDDLEFEPGTSFHYSNSGYVVLAAIIEKVSGTSYAAILRDSIFRPLGMKNSFFVTEKNVLRNSSDTLSENKKISSIESHSLSTGNTTKIATGYVNEAPEMDFPVQNIAGAGGITSSARDLLLFNQAIAEGKLLPRDMVKQMVQPRADWQEWKAGYGYGWMIDRGVFNASKKHVIEYHPGTEPGFYTMMLRQPDRGIVIILMNNKGDFPRFEITDLILDTLN